MFGWIARAGMLKVLGRRAVPLLAAWQVLQMVRGVRRNSSNANRVEPGTAPTARTLESRRRRF